MQEMLQSQAMQELFPGEAKKGDICGMVTALNDDLEDDKEVASIVKAVFEATTKAAKRRKLSQKVWPRDHLVTMQELRALQPPGGTAWYDPSLRRYQAFYGGGSCSRALRLHTQDGAARQVTQWAWTCHAMLGNDTADAPVGLFDENPAC